MKNKILLFFAVMLGYSYVSVANDSKMEVVTLYPAILKTEKNLLKSDLQDWNGKSLPKCQMKRGIGTPFSLIEPNLLIVSTDTKPNYWGTVKKVPAGHTYLAGAWVKNDNAKILFWFWGDYGKPPKRVNQRIHFFSGCSSILKNYLSPESQSLLCGDPEAWHLCYRLVEIPKEAKNFYLKMMIGTYFATGNITIANPFLIDVTKVADSGMILEIKGSKSIRNIKVIDLYNQDTIFSKTFEHPITDFKTEIPRTSFKHGLNGKLKFSGYVLQVEYTDGSVKEFSAPEKSATKYLS